MSETTEVCPLCGGNKVPGTATFSADLGSGVVVVRAVDATVCSQIVVSLTTGGLPQLAEGGAKKSEALIAAYTEKGRPGRYSCQCESEGIVRVASESRRQPGRTVRMLWKVGFLFCVTCGEW